MAIKPVERNIYLDIASGIYIVRKFKKGKDPLWESTGEKSIKAARAAKDAIIARWLGDRPKTSRRMMLDLFDEVLRIKKTKSWKTFASAETQIKNHLRPWFSEYAPFLDQFNESVFEKYIQFQCDKNSKRRLKHDREILMFTLNLARKKGLIQQSFSLRKADAKREIGKYYSDEEITTLLSRATPDLHFQILIAIKMGMRLGEILGLSWDRINLTNGFITLHPENTKTRRKRFVPIHNDLLAEFQSRYDAAKKIFVFPSPHGLPTHVSSNKTAWNTARTSKPPVKGRFHDLRHRAMTDMLAAGISETDVSKITGASPEIIKRVYHHIRKDTLEQMRNLNCGKFVIMGAK